uniref:G-protein coupled receptors family 1 profile domain-containing protein n=1 Tax=Plectus sambesii TaxID=2011161 RepID=A0A914VTU9_9BILA
MTTASIWCWLLATLMRYTAVYHPQMHLTRWRLGCKSLLLVVLISAVMNSWVSVTAVSGQDYCYQRPLFDHIEIDSWLHFVDILWSYVLPLLITVILDIRVMVKPPPGLESSRQESSKIDSKVVVRSNFINGRQKPFTQNKVIKSLVKQMETTEQSDQNMTTNKDTKEMVDNERNNLLIDGKPQFSKTGQSRSARARSSIAKWLLITTVKLLIITPDSVLRLVTFFCSCDLSSDPSSFMHFTVIFARMLYFVQFWCNAAYLFTVLRSGDVKMRREREQERTNANMRSGNNNNNSNSHLPLQSSPSSSL